MDKVLLHTPEGVRDIYAGEMQKKVTITENIHSVFRKNGFRDIQTPMFEYFDIFNKERGSVASKNMYKFFDREGYTLVLRPDITPSIARCAAKYYTDVKTPVRFCYNGNTFINNAEHQGKLKEFTQMGCEMILDNSSDADALMIVVLVESILNTGLKDFKISIGEAGFYKGLIEECNIDEETEDKLTQMIINKNNFGMEDVLDEKGIDKKYKDMFMKLPSLFGGVEVLEKADEVTDVKKSEKALERLRKVYDILKIYGLEEYVSFDLGMISYYKYYTGIVFNAYTYKTGDAIATGGRYDNLVGQFGKNAPAIGFAINVDMLMTALMRQKIEVDNGSVDTTVLFKHFNRKSAIALANFLRDKGENVSLTRKSSSIPDEDYLNQAKEDGNVKVYYIQNANDVCIYDFENDKKEEVKIDEIFNNCSC